MKKLISLLGILFLLTLFIPSNHAEAARGSGGSHGSGGHGGFRGDGGHGGFRGDGGHGGFRGFRGHEGFRGHRGFFPGLIIGGALGWGLWPYYYPPDYYYYPPPPYYYPPPEYYYPPTAQYGQVPPPAGQGSGGRMFIYPRQGQSEEKKAEDFDKCHGWAVGQTGFDPAKPPAGAPDAQTIQKSGDYFRAISACLDAQGYTVR